MTQTKKTPPASEGRPNTGHVSGIATIPRPGINLRQHGALTSTDDEVAYARGLADSGLEILLVVPWAETKPANNADMRAVRRDRGLPKSEKEAVHLATSDPDMVEAYVRRHWANRDRADETKALNLGVRVGQGSGLIIVDTDDDAQTAAFTDWWATNIGSACPSRTVASPGVAGTDHKNGGHWWFRTPEGYELPEKAPASVPIRGAEGTAQLMVRDRYVLIPPSVRASGPYRVTGDVLTAPQALLDLIESAAVAVPEPREYERDSSDPIDVWASSVSWDDLLTTAGWMHHHVVEACGCPTWTRPGATANPKSAVAHDPAVCQRGNDQLHVWSDTVIAEFATADMTKLRFIAHTWHGGDVSAAMSALGIQPLSALGGGVGLTAAELGEVDGDTDMPQTMVDRIATSVAVPIQARYTDAGLAQTAADCVLRGKFLSVTGLGWLRWTGTHWAECTSGAPTEAWRRYVLAQIASAATHPPMDKDGNPDLTAVDVWKKTATAARLAAVMKLAAGIIEIGADRLDADPDVLNTPTGTVDLRTGDLRPHDPGDLITKITRGAYRPGFDHPDVTAALEALPAPERAWMQRRIGQGITGHTTPDGVMPILQGSGENGKSLLTTDGLVPALGDYADVASPRLFAADRGSDHSTERADLRGKRLLIGEELSEGRSLDITALKRIQDVAHIKARYLYRDNITFQTSHSLFVTTNYVPVVSEVDHGTWRRLALVRFPYTFRKRAEDCIGDQDRVGDPGLKGRIKRNEDGQHDALVTWAVAGAVAWYADTGTALLPTPRITSDTRTWRASSDRILGFWDEHLVADNGAMVASTDLLAEFNRWLESNGHLPWSKETFGARFIGHALVSEHRLEKARPRSRTGLSRPSGGLSALPALASRPECWVGVRFRRPADDSREELASAPRNPFISATSAQARDQRG